jgi:hypothetical protein
MTTLVCPRCDACAQVAAQSPFDPWKSLLGDIAVRHPLQQVVALRALIDSSERNPIPEAAFSSEPVQVAALLIRLLESLSSWLHTLYVSATCLVLLMSCDVAGLGAGASGAVHEI